MILAINLLKKLKNPVKEFFMHLKMLDNEIKKFKNAKLLLTNN